MSLCFRRLFAQRPLARRPDERGRSGRWPSLRPFYRRPPAQRFAAAASSIISALALASCVTVPAQTQPPQAVAPPVAPAPAQPPTAPPVPQANLAGKTVVAMLLPLSGPSGQLGQAMLNAAQMAIYDLSDDKLEVVTEDTKGDASTAASDAQQAIGEGAQLILGPLLQAEVEAVKPIAQSAHIPVIAFSTATQLAGQGIYLMGFLPSEEVTRVTAYAHAQGHNRFAVFAPDTAYGHVIADAAKNAVAAQGATLTRSEFYDPGLANMGAAVRSFAAEGVDYDALFLPEGGARLKALAPQLPYYKIDPDQVKLLGTGLWDEPGLGSEPSLDGAWFAAPPPQARAGFVQRYAQLYGHEPPRLATLGYDSMALAAVLARGPQGADFSDTALTNPNGFSGLDGIFRFRSDGLVQRGLAVLQVGSDSNSVVDPAPQSFENIGY